MKDKLRVMAIPADENRKENPYNYILNTGLTDQGVTIIRYDLRSFLNWKGYDIVHLHWPENFLWARTRTEAYRAYVIFWLKLQFLRFIGKKLVWTVHNLKPHEGRWSSISAKAYRLLYQNANGFISLTQTAATAVQNNIELAEQNITVIPHPHYKNYYSNNINRFKSRERLGLPGNKFIFLFIGQVRAYKNVVSLVNAYNKLCYDDALLVIAGRVHEDVSEELAAAIANQKNILLFPTFIDDNDLQLYLNSADLVVAPFSKILNSGSVFLNLSFARPTLVPAAPTLLELQKQVGTKWLKTYDGELTAEHLHACRNEIVQNTEPDNPDLHLFDWESIAKKTKAFYQTLVS